MSGFDANSARGDLEKALGGSGQIVMPSDAQAPILTAPVRAALHQWLFEMNAEDELRSVGLKPRSRCLLSGPPGCGKTTLAHHIAARLGMPMLVVQSHEIISKWVGETGNNVGKLFREARRQRSGLALFFDEFDALAKKREALGGSGGDNERANTTIALLQEFDRYDGLLFAATNVTGTIDPALWRRFQMQIEIGFPGPGERFAIVKMYLDPFVADDDTVIAIADALSGASPALIREGCETIKRSIVLGPRMNLPTDLPSILDRFGDSASAAEGMPEPRLWTDRRSVLNELSAVPWPPERAS
jgi:DNA polymerase III delta prime subunit